MSRAAFEKNVQRIVESSRQTGRPIGESAARKMMQEAATRAERDAKQSGNGRLASYRDGERS